MPTIEEFGKKIKEKYPQYQNIDDAELGRKMLDKYPQYQGRVFSTDPQQQGELNKGGFINRAKETVQDAKEGFSNLKNKVFERSDRTNQLVNTNDSVFAKARNVFSQGVGFVGDVVGEGYKTAGKMLLSQEKEDKIAGGFESAVGKVLNTQAAQKIIGKYQELQQTRPEIAREIESALNLLDGFTSLSVGGAGAKQITKAGMKATKEGIDIVGDTAKLAKSIKTGGVERLDSVIDTGIEKAVRPSVAGKSSFKQLGQYKEKAREAVKTIVRYKDKIKLTDEVGEVVKGGLPQNLRQFSDAISQTKKAIYNKYTRLAKGAGKEATIDLKGVANSLKEVADNEIFQDLSPEIVKRAETLAASLTKRGTYTAEKAQSAIEALNNKLQSVYKNQSSINYSELLVDMMVANNLRKSVDELIENATGTAGYQKLKNLYGSLKTIEKDVAHRAMVDARKSPQGFFDISNIFTAGDLVQAVSNPEMLGKAAVQKGVLEYIKRINDPNRMIKKLFQKADKVLNNKFEPKSKLFNMAKEGKLKAGMSLENVSKKGSPSMGQIDENSAVIIDPDRFKKKFKDYNPLNHEKYSAMAKKQYTEALKTNKNGVVKFLAGGSGSGKSELLLPSLVENFDGIIVDGTFSNYSSVLNKIKQAEKVGKSIEINAILPRIESAWKFAQKRKLETGRGIELSDFIDKHIGFVNTLQKVLNNNPKVKVNLKDTRNIFTKKEARESGFLDNNREVLKILNSIKYSKSELLERLKEIKYSGKDLSTAENENKPETDRLIAYLESVGQLRA